MGEQRIITESDALHFVFSDAERPKFAVSLYRLWPWRFRTHKQLQYGCITMQQAAHKFCLAEGLSWCVRPGLQLCWK